jgi:hypothetical protein
MSYTPKVLLYVKEESDNEVRNTESRMKTLMGCAPLISLCTKTRKLTKALVIRWLQNTARRGRKFCSNETDTLCPENLKFRPSYVTEVIQVFLI